jgi:hypothetical protein
METLRSFVTWMETLTVKLNQSFSKLIKKAEQPRVLYLSGGLLKSLRLTACPSRIEPETEIFANMAPEEDIPGLWHY